MSDTHTPSVTWLDAAAWDRLTRRLGDAVGRAANTGTPVLVSVSSPLPGAADPVAIVATSRRVGEPWFCFEQPDRDRAAVASLGRAYELEAGEGDRFTGVQGSWRALSRRALADPVPLRGAGLVATGGFAFAARGGDSPAWSTFGSNSLLVPELSLARQGSAGWLTLNFAVTAERTPEELLERAKSRLGELCLNPLPMLDPSPIGRSEVRSLMPPAHYEEAVARAVQRIRAGELEKVVLAREVEVEAAAGYDSPAVLGILREAFPACFVFAVGRGDSTFLGASPELLIRRDGNRASTVALAGSTRRSADPAVDDHLGEQLLRSTKDRNENEIVARWIARTLAPHAVWVTAAREPGLVKVANIQHLGAPIRAQLAQPLDAVQLAGLLHPTPAVGGEPGAAAEPLIPALEGFDRGWYAGPVGWIDVAGDGEFCVALRCALLRGRTARLFAGAGIVADSDPAAELAETEIKLQALLPVLAG